jgi:membrane-associated phospholipid phosphatase
MTTDEERPPALACRKTAAVAWLERFVRELGSADWLVIGYLTALTAAVLCRPGSPERSLFLIRTAPMLAFAVVVLVVVRGGLLNDRFFAPLAHRLAIHGTVQLSYFQFRDFLPFVNPGSLDAQLYWIDIHVFSFEPSVWMERLATPWATEWFAFFFFSYFFFLAVHILPIVYFSRRTTLLAEFALGVLLCFGIGHVLYMIVPGYGPVRELAGGYQHPLPEGFWMRLVLSAVKTGGAQKDIFPSIHTAMPTYVAFFSFHHRDKLPFKYTWPVVGFFAANIVIATMFLRWHWLIDVVAGLVLSVSVFLATSRLSPREVRYRAARGLSPLWTPLLRTPAE